MIGRVFFAFTVQRYACIFYAGKNTRHGQGPIDVCSRNGQALVIDLVLYRLLDHCLSHGATRADLVINSKGKVCVCGDEGQVRVTGQGELKPARNRLTFHADLPCRAGEERYWNS